MAIANGTCVSFCYQPKAHFGLLWVRPWDNRGQCYTDEKRMQYCFHWNSGKTFGPQKTRIMNRRGREIRNKNHRVREVLILYIDR